MSCAIRQTSSKAWRFTEVEVLYISMALDSANRHERTPIFERCVVRCGCKDGNQKNTCFKEDYVFKFMLIILGSIDVDLIWRAS